MSDLGYEKHEHTAEAPEDSDRFYLLDGPDQLEPSRTSPLRCFEARDLIYFRTREGWRFDFIDGDFFELTGHDAKEFLSGKYSWLDLVHKRDLNVVSLSLRKAMESDRYYQAEHRIVKKDGEVRWVRMRGRVLPQDDGSIQSVQGVFNDITVQKNTELSLQSKHEAFAWVANSLEDGIYIISGDYRIEFMNKSLIETVGNHVGQVCYRALFQRDSVCPWSVMDTLRQDSCGFQEYHLPQSGRTFQVRSFPIKGRDGSVGKLGQLKDITKTKQLQFEVREFEARQKAIADAANMANLGIFIIQDHEGMEARFRYTNEAFCRITGYEPAALVNKGAADLIHPEDLQEAMERYRRRRRGEIMNQVYEIRLLRKDGNSITAFFSVAPSIFEGNLATVGFVRDITERKRVEKSLWMSQRLASIGKLAAEIAHEINNPLTSVLTFCKLVERIIGQEPFPVERLPELQQYMSFLGAETSRCADISRNLLDFSRHGDIEIKRNDIHLVLRKTLDILRHRAEMSQIRIVTSFARNVPHVFCDYKRLQQALVNLLWNGIEAMPEGGVLSVATAYRQDGDSVEIDIKDSGVGVPEENLDRIFEPFYTTKAETKGVGLGLSVAYGIIQQHEGQIRVASEPGQGTCFTIVLKAQLKEPWGGETV